MQLLDRLREVEVKLNGPYVGGMTEYWTRCRSYLLKQILEIQLRDFDTHTNKRRLPIR